MDSYTAGQARLRMRAILTSVERGEHVQIRRYSTPTAVVVPPDWFKRACDALGEPVPDFIPVPEKKAGEK
jgi:antitoxin (DNA-binding transcriptional repressor) of toxin-antitoxin stability system